MKAAFLAAAVFSALYGLQTVLLQSIVRVFISPLHLNFLINVLATLVVGFYLLMTKPSGLKIRSPKGLGYGILAGILGSGVADLLVLLGLQSSSSINWGILSRLMILTTFLLSVLFLKERFSWLKIFSVFLSIIGAFLVVFRFQISLVFNPGDLLFLGAVIAFGFLNIISQKALEYLTVSQLTFMRVSIGAIVLAIPVFLFFPIKEVSRWSLVVLNTFFLIAGINLVNLVIKKAGASFFSLSSNLVPVFTVIFAVFLLGDQPTLFQILGGILIISSIFLFQFQNLIDEKV
jgi:drug/metabolite transporter (DMT)-like permease